jgi:hypothetical protein
VLSLLGEVAKHDLRGAGMDRLKSGEPLLVRQGAAVGSIASSENPRLNLTLGFGLAGRGRLYFSGAVLEIVRLVATLVILLVSRHGLKTVGPAEPGNRFVDSALGRKMALHGAMSSQGD